MTETMQRWEIEAIGREHLKLNEVPLPSPGSGEILVAVGAVALNYRDKMVIESGRGLPLHFPFTPCSDLAGTVVEKGKGAERFEAGQRVISTFTPDWIEGPRPGTAREPAYRTLGGFYPGVLAQYVVMPEQWLVEAPVSLSDVEACTLPCAGITAWFALVERAGVRAGQTVLIPSTGGVALFGMQISQARGAEVIVSTSEGKMDRVRAMGIEHVVDRRREDWLEAIYAITDDRGVDVILDVIGGAHLGKSVQLAAIGGHICQIGSLEGFESSFPIMPLMLKDLTIHGIGTGSRRALEDLVRAVDQWALKPVIDTVYGFAEAQAAFDLLDRGPFGKIVIDFAV